MNDSHLHIFKTEGTINLKKLVTKIPTSISSLRKSISGAPRNSSDSLHKKTNKYLFIESTPLVDVNAITVRNSAEIIKTRCGKPCLVVDGYQHRLLRNNNGYLTWICVKEKQGCKGQIKMTTEYVLLHRTKHSCLQNAGTVALKKALDICKRRVREELNISVPQIFQEELHKLKFSGLEQLVKLPTYENVKSTLCKERRKVLGTLKNSESNQDSNQSSDIILDLTICPEFSTESKKSFTEDSSNKLTDHFSSEEKLSDTRSMPFLSVCVEDSKSAEFLTTKSGKPCLVFNGYQHRFLRNSAWGKTWICSKERDTYCTGRIKTTEDNIVIGKREHSCLSNDAELKWKKALEKAKKRVRDELLVPVPKIFEEELHELYSNGVELKYKLPTCETAKSALRKERRKVLKKSRTSCAVSNPADSPLSKHSKMKPSKAKDTILLPFVSVTDHPTAQLLNTKSGRELLVLDGYQHRINHETKTGINWLCLKEKTAGCSGRVKTTSDFFLIHKTSHCCLKNNVEVEIRKFKNICRQRVREELSVPVPIIYKEEVSKFSALSGNKLPSYTQIKSSLCRDRRAALQRLQNSSLNADDMKR